MVKYGKFAIFYHVLQYLRIISLRIHINYPDNFYCTPYHWLLDNDEGLLISSGVYIVVIMLSTNRLEV